MTFKSCYRSIVHGKWTANKLLSRKWALVAFTVAAAIGCDLAGRALGSDTLSYLGIVVPAYLVVEGALDWAWKRKNRGGGEDEE